MTEMSAERFRDHLISFLVPDAGGEEKNALIGVAISVHGPLFRFAPCDYDHPHNRLCAETQWFDIRNVIDPRIVGVVSSRTAA
jgi:hypothetical protein